jgi:hypothetical protein
MQALMVPAAATDSTFAPGVTVAATTVQAGDIVLIWRLSSS